MLRISHIRPNARIVSSDWLIKGHRPIDAGVSLQLHSLRGLSAIIVLIAHAFQIIISPVYHGMYGILGLAAQASVMVFFALSGFLIMKSISRNYLDNGKFSISQYTWARSVRILPPLVFSIFILLALYGIALLSFPTGTNDFEDAGGFMARKGFYIDLKSIIGSLFFLNGFVTANISANAPLWSLSFEVWYYVAIAIFFGIEGRPGLIMTVILIAIMTALNKSFGLYSIVWSSGAALAILHNKQMLPAVLFKFTAALFLAAALPIAYFYLKSFKDIVNLSEPHFFLIPYWNFTIGIFLSAILALIISGYIKVPSKWPSSANFSYTLYIIHFPFLLFTYGAFQPMISGSILLSFVVMITSSATCILISKLLSVVLEPTKRAR